MEAGIANAITAISSFKWRKTLFIYQNRSTYIANWVICWTVHSSQIKKDHFQWLFIWFKHAWNCIERKGIPPGLGQGEYPSFLYSLSFPVAFYVVWNMLETVYTYGSSRNGVSIVSFYATLVPKGLHHESAYGWSFIGLIQLQARCTHSSRICGNSSSIIIKPFPHWSHKRSELIISTENQNEYPTIVPTTDCCSLSYRFVTRCFKANVKLN